MELMLQARMMAGGVYAPSNEGEDRPFGVSLSWMGLFFSVLASGVQSSELSAKERELTSQVYSESRVEFPLCAYDAHSL